MQAFIHVPTLDQEYTRRCPALFVVRNDCNCATRERACLDLAVPRDIDPVAHFPEWVLRSERRERARAPRRKKIRRERQTIDQRTFRVWQKDVWPIRGFVCAHVQVHSIWFSLHSCPPQPL